MIVTCRKLVELATDYQEGALSTAHRALVRAHLAYCAHCRRYLDQLAATARALSSLGSAPAPPVDVDPLLARLRARRPAS